MKRKDKDPYSHISLYNESIVCLNTFEDKQFGNRLPKKYRFVYKTFQNWLVEQEFLWALYHVIEL